MKKILSLVFVLMLFATFTARAQTAEVTISLNEQFFEALLDAVFKNMNPPEFPLAGMREAEKERGGNAGKASFVNADFDEDRRPKTEDQNPTCNESIRLQREVDGVKTAVRLQNGRIYAPIAFTGNYNPPLVGCIEFSGVAETNITLEFDRERQALIGRAQVLNVNMSGTGGLGGGLLAGVVQKSIDKKVNPMRILQLDKMSFVVPVQNSGALRMKAVDIKTEVGNGVLNVRITYEFLKAG
jgi:hypothetical protein